MAAAYVPIRSTDFAGMTKMSFSFQLTNTNIPLSSTFFSDENRN